MFERIRRSLIRWLAKELLPLPSANEIIIFNKRGQMFIDGQELTGTEVQNLRAEVRFLEESRIWKLMNDYFDNLAKKKMFVEAESETMILFAKSILYTLEIQRTMVKNIKNSKLD